MKKYAAVFICFLILALNFTEVPLVNAENQNVRNFVTEEFERLSVNINDSALLSAAKNDQRRITFYSSLAAKLYNITGNSEYLDISEYAYNYIVSYWEENAQSSSNDFFIYGPLAESYKILLDNGRISKGDEEKIANFINASANGQTGDDNQVFSRCRGLILGYNLFPKCAFAGEWKSYVDKIWNEFKKKDYVNENAAGYNGIGLSMMIEVAKAMGKVDELPEKLFEDYAALISPSGALIEYGDDYFCEWYFAYPALKNAAKLYGRSDFDDLAERVLAFGKYNYPFEVSTAGYKNLEKLMNLYYLALAFDGGFNGSEKPQFTSQVTTRVNMAGETAYNKLVMSSENGFLVTELYPRGSHGHLNRTGAILYYEAYGVPMFHGMARHNKSALAANVPVITENELSINENFSPNTWRTESIPLDFIANGAGSMHISKLTFRLSSTKNVEQYFYLDNIRLTGRSGTLVLDDLDNISNWKRSDNPYTAETSMKTQGTGSVKMNVAYGGGYFFNSPTYNKTIDLSEYDTIKFDWAYSSETNSKQFGFTFRMYDENGDIADFNPGDVNITGNLTSANVSEFEGGSVATLCYSGLFSYDTTLTRKIYLFDDATIATEDSYSLGRSVETAGVYSVWQIYDTAKDNGEFYTWTGEKKTWYNGEGKKISPKTLAIKTMGALSGSTEGYNVTNSSVKAKILYEGKTLSGGEKMNVACVITPFVSEKETEKICYENNIISLLGGKYAAYGEVFDEKTEVCGNVYGKCAVVSNEKKTAYVYLAGYDSDGKLDKVHIEKAELNLGVNIVKTKKYENNCASWIMFVFDKNLAPLANIKGR